MKTLFLAVFLCSRVAIAVPGDSKAFPNPFRPSQGHTMVTFANVPTDSTIKIYTVAGEKVNEVFANPSGQAFWNAKNMSGSDVASGVYLALIQDSDFKRILKIVVQR